MKDIEPISSPQSEQSSDQIEREPMFDLDTILNGTDEREDRHAGRILRWGKAWKTADPNWEKRGITIEETDRKLGDKKMP